MDLFYVIVLALAIVVLILLLTYIGILMKYYNKKSTVFPPQASTCPDYWTTDAANQNMCNIPNSGSRNVGKIYDANQVNTLTPGTTFGLNAGKTSFDINDKQWSRGGADSVCTKKGWANQYSIVWDGVSNYNSC